MATTAYHASGYAHGNGHDCIPRERTGPHGEHHKCAKAYANADCGRQIPASTVLWLWQSAVYGVTHRNRLLSLSLSRPHKLLQSAPTLVLSHGSWTEKAPPAEDGHGGNNGRP